MFSYIYDTVLGKICVSANNNAVVGVHFFNSPIYELKETPLISRAYFEILEYFNGQRREFDLPLEPNGTKFQKEVWKALLTIPYGKTASYKDVAGIVGNPKGTRAVGGANNKNPIAIIIPCHRVIGSGGNLVGYAGGLDIKRRLLEIEKGLNV